MTGSETANWIAFAALGLGLFIQTALFSFFLGRLFQRVGDLRHDMDAVQATDADDGKAHGLFREAFARFEGRIEAKLEHLDTRVSDLTAALASLPPPVYTPRGRSKEAGS